MKILDFKFQKRSRPFYRSVTLFDLVKVKEELARLNREMEEPGFWDDPEKGQKAMRKKKSFESTIEKYEHIEAGLEEVLELIDMAQELEDVDSVPLILDNFKDLEERLEDLRITTLLTGKYDENNCILSLHAGTGGVDAMDWTLMLYRMYTRYCQKKGYRVSLLDYQDDTEAGIKSATIRVEGENAYGYLKNEKGVHRLVRISPFNAAGKRQTSFAGVEVIPEIEDDEELVIDPEDLRIDTYRSSGAGGQHVNTTDSAIRITHIPTNIVVTCQNERSQIQNKETAMKILRSKLIELKEEEQKETLKEIKGDFSLNTWGAQIRSYVMQPYTMVKDHRTSAQVSNVTQVLDGELDYFINEKLKQKED